MWCQGALVHGNGGLWSARWPRATAMDGGHTLAKRPGTIYPPQSGPPQRDVEEQET